MQDHLYCVQVPNGVRGSSVDQPHPRGQTGAGADPKTSHPVKWTYLD